MAKCNESDPILKALSIIDCKLNSTDIECNNCSKKHTCDWINALKILKNYVVSTYDNSAMEKVDK